MGRAASPPSPKEKELEAIADRLVTFWNGDWLGTPAHWCCDADGGRCHETDEVARDDAVDHVELLAETVEVLE